MRRPSPALAVALLALFVALGGPAEAKKLVVKAGSIGSKQIKDKSIAAKDLKPSLVKQLTAIADNGVTSAKIADGSVAAADLAADAVTGSKLDEKGVTASKLGDGAVGTAKLADGAVEGAKLAANAVAGANVRNGTLDAKDIGGFAGEMKVTLGAAGAGCTAGTSTSQTPLVAGQDLSNDAIVVTAPSGFPDVAVSARPAGTDIIRVTACGTGAPTGEFSFRYVTVDVS